MKRIIQVVEILGVELIWILTMKFFHLLFKCQAVWNILHLFVVVWVWLSSTLAVLIVNMIVFVSMAQFQTYLVLIFSTILILLLWRNTIWTPLSALLICLGCLFGIHLLCYKAVLYYLVDILFLVIEILLYFITLLNQSHWIWWILSCLLEILVLGESALLVWWFEHSPWVVIHVLENIIHMLVGFDDWRMCSFHQVVLARVHLRFVLIFSILAFYFKWCGANRFLFWHLWWFGLLFNLISQYRTLFE